MKINCVHADTCLPDYWSGHHLPHVSIPVHHGMKISELKSALHDELRQGYVMGSGDDARLLSADIVAPHEEKRAGKLTQAAHAAIERDVRHAVKGKRKCFTELELDNFDCVAYFVFIIVE